MHNSKIMIILDFSMENIFCNCILYTNESARKKKTRTHTPTIWKYIQYSESVAKRKRSKKQRKRKVKKFNDKLQTPETVECGAE